MKIQIQVVDLIKACEDLGLLSSQEGIQVMSLFDEEFAFFNALDLADSLHLHIKVADIQQLPLEKLLDYGAQIENQKKGYLKLHFDFGLNLIFSSISISQEDLAESAEQKRPRPFLDHVGVDLRQENERTLNLFKEIPQVSRSLAWAVLKQGGEGKAVFCCHTQVSQKLWVYPSQQASCQLILEFALGPLKVNPQSSGCDLRPANPFAASSSGNSCQSSARLNCD
jgi:hypothetical protein